MEMTFTNQEMSIIKKVMEKQEPVAITPLEKEHITHEELVLRKYAPTIAVRPALVDFFVHGMKEAVWQQTPGEELLVWWYEDRLTEEQRQQAYDMFAELPVEDRVYLLERMSKELLRHLIVSDRI